jgi:hypothetical protein
MTSDGEMIVHFVDIVVCFVDIDVSFVDLLTSLLLLSFHNYKYIFVPICLC